jgi:mono/diheme cytochrome c family protein
MKRVWLKRGALGLVALLVVIQLVPYGRDHSNPPATKQVTFASSEAQQVFTDACSDCHSNLTKWWWYSNIAPASWLIQSDVEGGRQRMNLSEWDRQQPPLGEIVDVIAKGEMPPLKYKIAPNHANARLSDKEKQILQDAFKEVYAKDPPPVGQG